MSLVSNRKLYGVTICAKKIELLGFATNDAERGTSARMAVRNSAVAPVAGPAGASLGTKNCPIPDNRGVGVLNDEGVAWICAFHLAMLDLCPDIS